MLFVKHTIIGVFWLEWVQNGPPSFLWKYPNRRGEGGEERRGGPLWSPAIPQKDGKYTRVKRRNSISLKKQYASKFPQLLGRALLLALALFIVACIDISATGSSHTTTTSRQTVSPPQNTIHYDNIQQTPVPGSVQVRVSLAEYTIVSSMTIFKAGTTYHFVVANRGHVVHETCFWSRRR